MITGVTAYSITEVNKLSQGTVMADRPSKKATVGAKATTFSGGVSVTCAQPQAVQELLLF